MNQTYQPKATGQKKVTRYRFFEVFTKTHSFVPVVLFLFFSLILLAYGYFELNLFNGVLLATFLIGIVTFTLAEYLIHRYIFHMTITTRVKKKIQYLFHGIHHEFPKDKERLAMPPLASVTLAILLFSLFYLGLRDLAWGFGAGFFSGYAGYLFVHYIVHAWRMPQNRLKVLWVNHNIHHYQNENVAFGVSSPLWDVIFGTQPQKVKLKTTKN